jgi:hypothetical protein
MIGLRNGTTEKTRGDLIRGQNRTGFNPDEAIRNAAYIKLKNFV